MCYKSVIFSIHRSLETTARVSVKKFNELNRISGADDIRVIATRNYLEMGDRL